MTGHSCLDMPDTKGRECAFCAYLDGRRPFTVLRKNDKVATMVTREQRGVAHLLIVPVAHCETILDLPDDAAAALMLELRSAARAIDRAFCRAGISIWQNNGADAHQAIPHLHFHVAGTLDGGGTEWGDVPELSIAQTDAIADQLRPFLV